MAEFQYHIIELIKTAILGSGSYGVVCKAKCDDLQCAAKLLHNALFKVNDPGAVTLIQRFEQECQFLNGIRHPHIIQYLGIHRDPDSGLPVLLMELAEENLTRHLERSHEQLPYFMQVNICHGIALALAYLHSNNIIHRDLSSNNVLMVGSKVKITDFGMSKLVGVDPRITPLTMCPGATVYMPPEALKEQPMYSKKLDCFSFGVLTIQVLTRQFPDPGVRFRSIEIEDVRIPMGKVDVPIPETERRYPHISLIDPSHPLLSTALQCLRDDDQKRPSAQEISQRLCELKENLRYSESLSRNVSPNYDQRIRELQQQNEGQSIQILLLQSDLFAKNHLIAEKGEEVRARLQEIQQLRQQVQELQCMVDARDEQLQELNRTHLIYPEPEGEEQDEQESEIVPNIDDEDIWEAFASKVTVGESQQVGELQTTDLTSTGGGNIRDHSMINENLCRFCGVPLIQPKVAQHPVENWEDGMLESEEVEGERELAGPMPVDMSVETYQTHFASEHHMTQERLYTEFSLEVNGWQYSEMKRELKTISDECKKFDEVMIDRNLDFVLTAIRDELDRNEKRIEDIKQRCDWRSGLLEVKGEMVNQMEFLIGRGRQELKRTEQRIQQALNQQLVEEEPEDQLQEDTYDAPEEIEQAGPPNMQGEKTRKRMKKKHHRKNRK